MSLAQPILVALNVAEEAVEAVALAFPGGDDEGLGSVGCMRRSMTPVALST